MGNTPEAASLESDAADDGTIGLGQQDDFAGMVQVILNPSSFFTDSRREFVGFNYEKLCIFGNGPNVSKQCFRIIGLCGADGELLAGLVAEGLRFD